MKFFSALACTLLLGAACSKIDVSRPIVVANGEGQPVANFGWLDVYKAFHWVAENIAAFGGDPENITGMGEFLGCR